MFLFLWKKVEPNACSGNKLGFAIVAGTFYWVVRIKLLIISFMFSIFVPSSRNTLIDILLGRKNAGDSPKKNRARSRSRSPVKSRIRNSGDRATDVTSSPGRRTSPRKNAQRLLEQNAEESVWHDHDPQIGFLQPLALSHKLAIEPRSTTKIMSVKKSRKDKPTSRTSW